MDAAQFVAKNYYNQHPRLLEFVLSKPPDRVKYTNLALRKPDFEEIEQLGRRGRHLERHRALRGLHRCLVRAR
jgi:hypothetical protein